MSVTPETIRGKSKIVYFSHTPPKIRRCVAGLINSFARGQISRAAMNAYLTDILPPGLNVDCGPYEVQLNFVLGDESMPAIVFRGKAASIDGRCPACNALDARYLAGGGASISAWCMNCSCVFSIPKEVRSR
ncbi:MAG: hypothetical protein C4570_06605 [Ammonifex sp.]|jgi:hypothetical protein|nr:MAG: hypothetical protein C4570_06605 [Ammonifex sp.]